MELPPRVKSPELVGPEPQPLARVRSSGGVVRPSVTRRACVCARAPGSVVRVTDALSCCFPRSPFAAPSVGAEHCAYVSPRGQSVLSPRLKVPSRKARTWAWGGTFRASSVLRGTPWRKWWERPYLQALWVQLRLSEPQHPHTSDPKNLGSSLLLTVGSVCDIRADVALEGIFSVCIALKRAWCLVISFFPSPAILQKKDLEKEEKL